jgi:hypothetical protein
MICTAAALLLQTASPCTPRIGRSGTLTRAAFSWQRCMRLQAIMHRQEQCSAASTDLRPRRRGRALSVYFERVANWDDVRRIALSLPDTAEGTSRDHAFWRVRDRGFVWERPLRQSDLRALGNDAPTGPILGARVEHLGAKAALLAAEPEVFFTTPHFDGYPAVLVRLERIPLDELDELIVEAWLARAPKRLAQEYVKTHLQSPGG